MQVQIAGKKIEVGAALQERIAFGLENRVSKYFNRTGEAFVTVSKPGWAFYCDCSIHLPSGVTLQAHGEGDDGYQAFEMALDKIEKRVRRYKRRLRSHGTGAGNEIDISYTVVAGPDDDDDIEVAEDFSPAVVAESTMTLKTMSVASAVIELDTKDSPVVVFRNAGSDAVNIVYRRPDGNIGWIDPSKTARG